MRTRSRGKGEEATFTQRKRREQLVACAIDAIVERGFQGASVGEVARRAGVSKGVVTYHFAAKDDLIFAAVACIFDSITEGLETRLRGTSPDTFVVYYISAWVDSYATNSRYVFALREIWGNFRNAEGQQHVGPEAIAGELAVVQSALEHGQARGLRAKFDARVMAVSIKAALDGLLEQYVSNRELDLKAYGAELVTLFERATRPDTWSTPAATYDSQEPRDSTADRRQPGAVRLI